MRSYCANCKSMQSLAWLVTFSIASDFFHIFQIGVNLQNLEKQSHHALYNMWCPARIDSWPSAILTLYKWSTSNLCLPKCIIFRWHLPFFKKSNCMSTLQAAVNGEIKHLDDWLISNKLTLSCSKTNFMVLTRSHEVQKIKINVVAGAVEEVNQVKYLGVLIDNQWKWRQQLDHVCKKLACASYALLKLRAFSPISTQNCLLCSSSSTSFIWTGLLE